MYISNLKLDQYDVNFAGLSKLAEDSRVKLQDLPGKIVPPDQLHQLDLNDFGLVLFGDDGIKALFPIIDARNTAISLQYLKKNAPLLEKIDPKLLPTAKYFVGKAAKDFGLVDNFSPKNIIDTNIIDLRGKKIQIVPKKQPVKQEAHKIAEQIDDILHNMEIRPSSRLEAANIIANAADANPELANALQEIIPTEYAQIKNITQSVPSPTKIKQTIVIMKRMAPGDEPISLLDKLQAAVGASQNNIPIDVLDTIHSLMTGYRGSFSNELPDPMTLLDNPGKVTIVIGRAGGQQFNPEMLHALLSGKAALLRHALSPKIAESVINDPFTVEQLPEDIQDLILDMIGD